MRHGRRPDSRRDLAPTAPALGSCLSVSLLIHGVIVALWVAEPRSTTMQPLQHLQVTLLGPPSPSVVAPSQVRPAPLSPAMTSASTAVRTDRLVSPAPGSPRMPASPKKLPEAAVAAPVAASVPAPSPALAPVHSPAHTLTHVPVQEPVSAQSHAAAARSEAMDAAALDAYAQSLSVLLARHRAYPAAAAMRGWEGEVRLTLRIARRGALIDVQVQRSSGYDVLDRNAVQLVQQASPLPLPPEGLAGSEFQVSIPIQYRLRKNS